MGFLQANYDKPGAGVRKDAPQKKEFVLFFEIYARKFWNLIQAVISKDPVSGTLAGKDVKQIVFHMPTVIHL